MSASATFCQKGVQFCWGVSGKLSRGLMGLGTTCLQRLFAFVGVDGAELLVLTEVRLS